MATSVAAATACSARTESTASSANAIVVDAGDTEHESRVTLQLPTDACLPDTSCTRMLGAYPPMFIDGTYVSLGNALRVKAGPHTIAVNALGGTFSTTPDQDLTIVVPIAARRCVGAPLPAVPPTDFGARISVVNAPCPTSVQGSTDGVPRITNPIESFHACSRIWTEYRPGVQSDCSRAKLDAYSQESFAFVSDTAGCTTTGVGYAGCMLAAAVIASTPGVAPLTDGFQAYPPGAIQAIVNGQAQTLTLKSGDETYFELSLPVLGSVPPTFETDLAFADPRVNPDAARGTITSSCPGDATFTFPLATGTAPTMPLHAFVNPSCTYTLNVGGRSETLSQTSTNHVTLRRLDVNGVAIRREDGSTYTAQGAYSLNYGGALVAGPFPTGTGIDVLPGTYEFSLSYTDFDGPKTQTRTLTF